MLPEPSCCLSTMIWWLWQGPPLSSTALAARGKSVCTQCNAIQYSTIQYNSMQYNRRCSEREKKEQTAACISSHQSYPAIEIRTIICHAVFWLFMMFAESQIKAFERDPEYCKNGCEKLFLRNPRDAGSRSRKRLQFIHGVCSHRHVCPRIMRNNSTIFFFRNRSIDRTSSIYMRVVSASR